MVRNDSAAFFPPNILDFPALLFTLEHRKGGLGASRPISEWRSPYSEKGLMSGFAVLAFALVGFAVCWLAVPLIRRFPCASSRRQLHHTHEAPVSRFGGLALVVAFAILSIIAFALNPQGKHSSSERLVVVAASLAMFSLGFVDDLKALGAKRKLLGQILIACAVYFAGIQITQFRDPVTGTALHLGVFACPITVFWLVAFTNLVNLIDGVDGLAAGICLMLMGLLFYVASQSALVFSLVITAGMCGALLGFLCYNFPPAKIYLGDGGAYFLGFLAGMLSMTHSQKGTVAAALLAPLFVLALPIVDVALAILRRGIKGLPLFRPDRRHLHHRLAEAGLSRTRIVLGFYGCTLFFLVLALGVCLSKGKWLPILFGIGCAVLLISARSFSFSREWFAIGKMLGNSLEIRKQVRYALTLSAWIELEAERSRSAEDLWTDFGFAVRKLGFTAVTLTTPDGRKHLNWTGNIKRHPSHRRSRDLGDNSWLEFAAPTAEFELHPFELMSDLAAETWIKACRCWEQAHQCPLRFNQPARTAPEPEQQVQFPLLRGDAPRPA
jgi:UDP-GlcNAc:undecaprenyl-phosphate GlcNAc-1-phosphate transferase